MRIIATCLLVFVLTNCAAQSIDKLTEKNGYMDLRLEMALDTFRSKVKTEKLYPNGPGLERCRIIDSDYLKIGDCALVSGWAWFFKGKLIRLQTSGLNNYDCLLETYIRLFGEPTQSDTTYKSNKWRGHKAFAILWFNPSMDATNIWLTSKRLDDKYGRYCKIRKLKKYPLGRV